jgi:hypothetical protein
LYAIGSRRSITFAGQFYEPFYDRGRHFNIQDINGLLGAAAIVERLGDPASGSF